MSRTLKLIISLFSYILIICTKKKNIAKLKSINNNFLLKFYALYQNMLNIKGHKSM